MSMIKSDLTGAFSLSVAMSGHVFIWERGVRKPEKGTLPVYSTDTREDAEALRVRHCRLARDGSGLYCLNEFGGTLEALGAVSDLFRASHAAMLAKRPPANDAA